MGAVCCAHGYISEEREEGESGSRLWTPSEWKDEEKKAKAVHPKGAHQKERASASRPAAPSTNTPSRATPPPQDALPPASADPARRRPGGNTSSAETLVPEPKVPTSTSLPPSPPPAISTVPPTPAANAATAPPAQSAALTASATPIHSSATSARAAPVQSVPPVARAKPVQSAALAAGTAPAARPDAAVAPSKIKDAVVLEDDDPKRSNSVNPLMIWDANGVGKTESCKPSHEVDPERRKLFLEIAESNYQCRKQWTVPRTILFEQWRAVDAEANPGKLQWGARSAEVSFSGLSTADALLMFAKSPSRKGYVCGLNFANGNHVGGGYKTGSVAQEEDLCRRLPNLYTSLNKARQAGCYPFGPCTCATPAEASSPKRPTQHPMGFGPHKASKDVLYTPGLTIARKGEEFQFELLPHAQQAKVSLVTAAAPNIRFASEVNDLGLVYNTVKNILIAPKVLQPEVSILVLGAWGCGAFGGDPVQIAELFARAISTDKLGSLYREVHFAIPLAGKSWKEGNNAIFKETFKRFGVSFKES